MRGLAGSGQCEIGLEKNVRSGRSTPQMGGRARAGKCEVGPEPDNARSGAGTCEVGSEVPNSEIEQELENVRTGWSRTMRGWAAARKCEVWPEPYQARSGQSGKCEVGPGQDSPDAAIMIFIFYVNVAFFYVTYPTS